MHSLVAWEYSCKKLELAQVLGRHGVSLTLRLQLRRRDELPASPLARAAAGPTGSAVLEQQLHRVGTNRGP